MRVRLVRKETIEEFAKDNARGRSSCRDWLMKVKYADWESPGDMRATFNTADLLGNGSNRVVFNIGGNDFRLICKYWFGETKTHLYVKWIGTHAEYDRLCKNDKQYTVDDF